MRAAFILFFLGTWALFSAFLYRHWEDERQKRLAEYSRGLAVTYRAGVNMYRLTTEILFNEVIQNPEVIATFAKGVSGDAETANLARGKLYRLLSPAYAHLKQQEVHQVQFHTADGHSFLRFHSPDRFGDPLFDVRPTVLLANTQKRVAFGFEIGRVDPGFRYVYPLFSGTRHLGSVEASVAFRAVRKAMKEVDPEREYLLVLRKDVAGRSLFEDQRAFFALSPLHDGFLVEDPQLNLPTSPPPLPAEVAALNQQIRGDPRLQSGMAAGQAFSLAFSAGTEDWAVSFEPINDLLGRDIAYLVSYARAPFITTLYHEFIGALLFLLATLAALSALVVKLFRAHAGLRKEKQFLQIINDTIADGLCVMDEQGRVVQVNSAFTEILGYRQDEIVGAIGHRIFHVHAGGEKIPLEQCPIIAAIRKGENYRGQETFRHKNGRILAVDLTCRPLSKEACMAGSLTAFRASAEHQHEV